MINKIRFCREINDFAKGGFVRKNVKKFTFVRIDDPVFARALYESNGSDSSVDNKYDPWVNLTELDGGLENAALAGLSPSRANYFSRLIVCYTDTLARHIQKAGGFPGGVVSPSEIATDFTSIYIYAMATVDSGEVIRLYEDMFLAYQSGGWPCGWLGKYPEGKIVVFYPS